MPACVSFKVEPSFPFQIALGPAVGTRQNRVDTSVVDIGHETGADGVVHISDLFALPFDPVKHLSGIRNKWLI